MKLLHDLKWWTPALLLGAVVLLVALGAVLPWC